MMEVRSKPFVMNMAWLKDCPTNFPGKSSVIGEHEIVRVKCILASEYT